MTDRKIVMVSGGFDPVHKGHIQMFEEAKALGDVLIVVLNGDSWLQRKKGRFFMNSEERAYIIKSLKMVDEVYVLDSERNDVSEALYLYEPDIFANGGDRKEEKDIPEAEACKELGVEMVFNVGGGKIQSSSELLENYNKNVD